MPVLPPKGLFPGRGPAGRGMPGCGPTGRPAGISAATSVVAAATTGAGTSTAAGGVGGGVSIVGATSAADAGDCVSWSAGGAVDFFAVVFLAVAFLTGASLGAGAGIASLSLRTTGASTVDEADFTNSPSSWSLARTTLLSTPSSFASSCTRTFDTILLSWSGPCSGPSVRRTPHCSVISEQSFRTRSLRTRSFGECPQRKLPNSSLCIRGGCLGPT